MPQITAILLKNQIVTVAMAAMAKNGLHVKKMFSMSEDEFDELLPTLKGEFIVVGNFRSVQQDQLHLPYVDPKLLDNLVTNEIRKTHHEQPDCSFFYQVIGEIFQDGKRFIKIAYFIYHNDDLTPFLNRFVTHNKHVSALYVSSYALSRLVARSTDDADEAVLCIADMEDEKTLFVLQNRQLLFTRDIQSDGHGFASSDILNINMTIDYCFQALRIRPAKALLINSTLPDQSGSRIMLPAACFSPPDDLGISEDDFRRYCVPLAALVCRQESGAGDLLPAEYKTFFSRKSIMQYGVMILLLLILMTIAGIGSKTFTVLGNKALINGIRNELGNVDQEIARYERTCNDLARVRPLITRLNTANTFPQMQRILLSLQCLKIKNTEIVSIGLSKKDSGVSIQIQGTIFAASMNDMQTVFEELLSAVRNQGLEIVSQNVEVQKKSFQLEAMKKI